MVYFSREICMLSVGDKSFVCALVIYTWMNFVRHPRFFLLFLPRTSRKSLAFPSVGLPMRLRKIPSSCRRYCGDSSMPITMMWSRRMNFYRSSISRSRSSSSSDHPWRLTQRICIKLVNTIWSSHTRRHRKNRRPKHSAHTNKTSLILAWKHIHNYGYMYESSSA